jgi:hypothetical protein
MAELTGAARGALRSRLLATAIHLASSAALAAALVVLVMRVWYPGALFELAKGRDIFLLLLGVDITLGPLLTLVVFNVKKPRRELARDISIIAFVQLAAMAYGVTTILQARPAFIVYNAGQFNVPLATELLAGAASEAADGPAPAAPWWGPELVAAKLPDSIEERNAILFLAAGGGGDVFQMPRYFQDYGSARTEVASRARTPEALADELRVEPARVRAALARVAPSEAATGVLPLVVRRSTAIAVVRLPSGDWLGFAPLPD